MERHNVNEAKRSKQITKHLFDNRKNLTEEQYVSFIEEFDFLDIEPFTLILVDWGLQLETYELVWDGEKKHFNKLNQEPKIWSSSTLYTDEMKQLRKQWFKDWLQKNKIFNQDNILKFHKSENLGTPETSIKMKRDFVETVSVTSVIKEESKVSISYFDFLEKLEKLSNV